MRALKRFSWRYLNGLNSLSQFQCRSFLFIFLSLCFFSRLLILWLLFEIAHIRAFIYVFIIFFRISLLFLFAPQRERQSDGVCVCVCFSFLDFANNSESAGCFDCGNASFRGRLTVKIKKEVTRNDKRRQRPSQERTSFTFLNKNFCSFLESCAR